ncbi:MULTISPECIES: hypothetical protein [Streptomyces]|uniref:hypothetical protein n=1 Tax=Streptomyces TaxID=1883 RepID=UPI000BF022A2|nr:MULTISPECIES: hypothetical protein [Streptomyces]MCX4501025.1 hypothetical protein [Streptomyces anulatus]
MASSPFGPAKPNKPSTITLYSGPGYTGEKCTLPVDDRTYSLAATGLTKIASLKINWVKKSHAPGAPYVRLYTKRPTSAQGDSGDGTYATFKADTTDTETWASATHVKAAFPSGDGNSSGSGSSWGTTQERTIYDTLP